MCAQFHPLHLIIVAIQNDTFTTSQRYYSMSLSDKQVPLIITISVKERIKKNEWEEIKGCPLEWAPHNLVIWEVLLHMPLGTTQYKIVSGDGLIEGHSVTWADLYLSS